MSSPASKICDNAGSDAGSSDAVPGWPGGKSGPGIYQRLINLIPRHRILVSAFAGKCGVVRHIKPAENTIVIDADEMICEWWSSWRRTKAGRHLEIHHCDSIEWLRHRFGFTEYPASGSCDGRSHGTGSRLTRGLSPTSATPDPASTATVAELRVPAATHENPTEYFVFADPPYVLSERAHGKQYACELTDADHLRLLRILTQIPASAAGIMVCGYSSPLYASLEPWFSIDHRVPTRGGLQDERIWLNYKPPAELHDYRYLGDCRRNRERIRRRQINWREQLEKMNPMERAAMLEELSK